MNSLEHYALKIRPSLDAFIRGPSKASLEAFENEVKFFDWKNLRLFDAQLLIPLVLKLDELNGFNEDIQSRTINCIKYITSKQYINDVKGLRTTLIIILKQIRCFDKVSTKSNLSEEIKLAVVECIDETICQSTGDVLESFYTPESLSLIGHILLTLVEFIEYERYKKLRLASVKCLMTMFYVNDRADLMDVVLRSQVADTTFIYLPKVITVLSNMAISDETTGDILKLNAIKALGRILCLMYEETRGDFLKTSYTSEEFKKLVQNSLERNEKNFNDLDNEILGINKRKQQLMERMEQMQKDGRTPEWYGASSRKFRIIFNKLHILPSHSSHSIRYHFADMCCNLLVYCSQNMSENFLSLLENIVAMSQDEDEKIRSLCKSTLRKVQSNGSDGVLFDENSDVLFEKHLTLLPRIIMRCQEDAQYAELLFLKGFFSTLSNTKLRLIFTYPKNAQSFIQCLLEAAHLLMNRDFISEEYALHQIETNLSENHEATKLPWRHFKYLTSDRCVGVLKSICGIIGSKKHVNQIFYKHLMDLLSEAHPAMNETILIILWMMTESSLVPKDGGLSDRFIKELCEDKHWHLSLIADSTYRLKTDKPSSWFVDRTPGLYESAIEIRTQDCDSDDDDDDENVNERVTLNDVQFNILHTCIVMDALGHCASFIGDTFDKYTFISLHKVLMKFASNNSLIHKSAYFALLSIQKALKYSTTSQLIEGNTDYISHHLNTLLKKSLDNNEAVDILYSVLQFSSQKSLPHISKVFETIQEECSKGHQRSNVVSFLKVYMSFLKNISRWMQESECQVDSLTTSIELEQPDILASWLDRIKNPSTLDDLTFQNDKTISNDDNGQEEPTEEEMNEKKDIDEMEETCLPSHIKTVVQILNHVVKFISSTEQSHQILSLECLIVGIPSLREYENQLLPIVHSIWFPLVEKFSQKDPLVLNRCFTLLHLLGKYSKEFILKRSLEHVVPFLKKFLLDAASRSQMEYPKAATQDYKLQKILLENLADFVKSLQIDGKHLNEIIDVSVLYLSQKQPKEFQELCEKMFINFLHLNRPLTYAILIRKSHLKEFKANIEKLLFHIGIGC